GDTLSAVIIEGITGYDPQKATILDFGTTTCSPCMKSLKSMNSLPRTFYEDLQVFFVSKEPQRTVKRFLSHSPIGKDIRIPIIAADTVLHAAFPHISEPHIVWIDRNGVVKAITDHHYVNKETLQELIEGQDFTEW